MTPETDAAGDKKPLSEQAVADWLLAHPEFFQEHRKLLTRLSIPHPAGGAISLVERQVEILRQETRQLEQRLVDWMEIARDNDRLLARLHALGVALLAADERSQRIAILDRRLREDFGSAAVALLLHGDAQAGDAAPLRRLAAKDPALEGLRESLAGGRPFCRALSDHWRSALFGGDADLASAAFVPLGGNGELGLLALASREATHFHPGLDTTYLARLGELATAALGGGFA
ncbi:MAG TPA: DUF484 family protein [Gammaproteobacteria bacterium]|nr:DUF484 family protein [Gammaproteobacteria bacterium]